MRGMLITLTAVCLLSMGGCDSGTSTTTTTTTTTTPSKTEALKEDLQKMGQDIKDEAHVAATQVGPAWDKTKAETRDLVHRAATKVADMTATQPTATQPQ